jgi:hypothetical protein
VAAGDCFCLIGLEIDADLLLNAWLDNGEGINFKNGLVFGVFSFGKWDFSPVN